MERRAGGDWAAPSSVAVRANVERDGSRNFGADEVQHPGGLDSGELYRRLDALEGALDVFVGVAEGDGAAVGAGGGVFGFAEFGEKPVDLCGVEGLVDLDGGVAGDGGRGAAAAGFLVFALVVAGRVGESPSQQGL